MKSKKTNIQQQIFYIITVPTNSIDQQITEPLDFELTCLKEIHSAISIVDF